MKPLVSNGLAFSYIRCSTPKQEAGDTGRRQLAGARKYAEKNGLMLSEDGYDDLGISAFRGKNTEEGSDLNALIAAIKAGTIPKGSTLIIENLDRLSRDFITNSLTLFMEIIKAGVIIVTLMDGKVYTQESIRQNPFDLMYSIMILARGHEESVAKSDRTGAAWRAAQANADKKKIAQNYPGWLSLKDNQFRVLEDRAAIIREIFQQYLAGKGTNSIARDLNSRGILTFTGKKWFQTTVKFYLRFPAVIGEYHAGRREAGKKIKTGQIVKGYYPAIISEEDFFRTQTRLQLNPSKQGRPQTADANLFPGLVHCGYCGGSMGIYNAKQSSNYVCWNAVQGGCLRVAYPKANIEMHVVSILKGVLYEKAASNIDKDKLENLEGLIADTESKIRKLVQIVEAGAAVDSVLSRLKELKTLLEQHQRELAHEKSQVEAAHNPKIFLRWVHEAHVLGKSEERLAIAPFLRRHIKSIRLFPAGDAQKEYQVRLLAMAAKGIRGHQCFRTIRKELRTDEIRYCLLQLKYTVKLDGVITDTLPLDRYPLHLARLSDGSFETREAL